MQQWQAIERARAVEPRARRVRLLKRAADPDLACAVLLHEAVKDHASELARGGGQQQALDALGAQFGDRVAGLRSVD